MPLQGAQLKEHILNRLGYGQSQWNSDRYDALGADAYIAEQFAGTLPGFPPDSPSSLVYVQRNVFDNRQLEGVLTNFWFNHFNVFAPPQSLAGLELNDYLNVAIRPNVFGPFETLLVAIAKSPAMLDYLDNINNDKEAPNQNYARELMELHTIGVDGGYTEKDVAAVARILTGWGVGVGEEFDDLFFTFFPSRHDFGSKLVLGEDFPAGAGLEEGEALLAMLASHPSAALFLGHKLCVHFISETPSASLVAQLATVYHDTDGSIADVLTTLFASDDFVADDAFRAKAKSPHRWLASALQAVGLTDPNSNEFFNAVFPLLDLMGDAGEEPYRYPAPNGYPDRAAFWVSPVSLLKRVTAAEVVSSSFFNQLALRAGTNGGDPASAVDAIAAVLLPGGIADATRNAVLDFLANRPDLTNDQRLAAIGLLLLSSPEFMRY